VIPDTITEEDVVNYLADLFHEMATLDQSEVKVIG